MHEGVGMWCCCTTGDTIEDHDQVRKTASDIDVWEGNDYHSQEDAIAVVSDRPDQRSFKVRVQMPKYQYSGLLLEAPGGPYLRVTKIDGFSSVAEYNRLCGSEDDRVKSGDFVIAVNDITTDSATMCMELSAGGTIELTLSRPVELVVPELCKVNDSIGLDLSQQQGNSSVVIRQVTPDGAIARWNQTAGPQQRIRPNDHIVAVDGKKGTMEELIRALKDTEKPSLLINRPRTRGLLRSASLESVG